MKYQTQILSFLLISKQKSVASLHFLCLHVPFRIAAASSTPLNSLYIHSPPLHDLVTLSFEQGWVSCHLPLPTSVLRKKLKGKYRA